MYISVMEKRDEQRKLERNLADRGLAARTRDCREVYAATGDHRAAIRAYCAGNKWLEENAKAVGNW